MWRVFPFLREFVPPARVCFYSGRSFPPPRAPPPFFVSVLSTEYVLSTITNMRKHELSTVPTTKTNHVSRLAAFVLCGELERGSGKEPL